MAWVGHEGAWSMNEDHVLADGSKLNIRAAGPHPHFEDFYVFVMDRSDGLPYRKHGADARLEALTLSGEPADEWRDRLAGCLGIESNAGDVALGFTRGSHPSVRASLRFTTPSAQEPIELGAGCVWFTA